MKLLCVIKRYLQNKSQTTREEEYNPSKLNIYEVSGERISNGEKYLIFVNKSNHVTELPHNIFEARKERATKQFENSFLNLL